MSTYEDLGNIFPRMVSGTKLEIAQCCSRLVDTRRKDVAQGSSFAVVSGITTPGRLRLFLSEVSYQYLVREGLVTSSPLHRTAMPDVPPGVDPQEYMALEMEADGVTNQPPVDEGPYIKGKKYFIVYQSATQHYPRCAVMVYLSMDKDNITFSARPVAGTQVIPRYWMISEQPVEDDEKVYLNRRYKP